jgi:DNA-binding CsgD family transcriptional regulator
MKRPLLVSMIPLLALPGSLLAAPQPRQQRPKGAEKAEKAEKARPERPVKTKKVTEGRWVAATPEKMAEQAAARAKASARLAELTPREWQVMDLVLDGHPNKNIAADLGISQRTVENHRASVMLKSGVKSLPALARLVMAVTGPDALFEPTELPHTPSWFSPAPQTAMGRF